MINYKLLNLYVESMLKVFGKIILNGVFEQIHLLTKIFKIPKYQILYLQYFKYQSQNVSILNTAHLCLQVHLEVLFHLNHCCHCAPVV